jgi:cation transport ATPase
MLHLLYLLFLIFTMIRTCLTAEEYFTKRSLRDVKDLKDSNPDSALVLDESGDLALQPISNMSYSEVPVQDVKVGSIILVRAGEVRLSSK